MPSLFPTISPNVPNVKMREGRARGIQARRLAEAVAGAATSAEGIERDTLARLAERAGRLSDRARGLRGWP